MSWPNSPWRTSSAPGSSWLICGWAAPCMSCTDRACSSAVSTAVTRAGESSSPQGVWRPNDTRAQLA